jgi:hypothetical protein
MINLCAPAIVYLIFSITQILIDLYSGQNKIASTKVLVTILVTLLLNILCEKGFNSVAWLIVLIPFIFMTVILALIIYIFGYDTITGNFNNKNPTSDLSNNSVTTDNLGNIIIYDPEYNPKQNPVYYESPNIIIPKSSPNNNIVTGQNNQYSPPNSFYNFFIPSGSSSPAYQS